MKIEKPSYDDLLKNAVRVLFLSFMLAVAGCAMTFPSYEVDRALIELMPKDIAAQYVNNHQTFDTCQWAESGAYYRPSPGLFTNSSPSFRAFSENEFRYVISQKKVYSDEYFTMEVYIRSPTKRLPDICTIADSLYGADRPFRSEQEVADMVSALESLGVNPEWTNR